MMLRFTLPLFLLSYTLLFATDTHQPSWKTDRINLITMPKGGTNLIMKLFAYLVEETEGKLSFSQAHTMDVPIDKRNSPLKIIMIRDPRDAMVSSVEWVNWHVQTGRDTAWFNKNWPGKSFKEKLHILLYPRIPRHLNAFEYINILHFTRDCHNCVVRFEDLIGSRGGGSDVKQKETLDRILAYIGLKLPESRVDAIAKQLFGGTFTFRKGCIGRWKEYINDAEMRGWMNFRLGEVMMELGYIKDYHW